MFKNNNGVLVGEYVYHVRADRKYTMLYRFWSAPLTTPDTSYSAPHIEVINVECPAGAIGYAKTVKGVVLFSEENPEAKQIIASKAYENEVGRYFPGKIRAGDYRIELVFKVYSPIHHDNELYHLNF